MLLTDTLASKNSVYSFQRSRFNSPGFGFQIGLWAEEPAIGGLAISELAISELAMTCESSSRFSRSSGMTPMCSVEPLMRYCLAASLEHQENASLRACASEVSKMPSSARASMAARVLGWRNRRSIASVDELQ